MLVNNKPTIVRVPVATAPAQATAPTITRNSSDQDITDAVAQGFGSLVSWGYSYNWQGETKSKIEECFTACGIDLDLQDITDAHATRSGCTAFRKWKNGGETFRCEVSDKNKSNGEITVSVQKQEKVGKKTDWVAIESLTYNKGAFVAPANTDAGKRVQALILHRSTHYTGMEFTRWILKPMMFNNHAVKLMDIDGLYYMIQSKDDLVQKIKMACDLLNVRFRKRNLLKSSDNVSDMAENAQDGLVARIDEVLETLAKWEAKSKIRKSSETALYAELDSIQVEAEVLSDALGFALESLTAQIDSAKNRAVEMINGQDDFGCPAPQEGSLNRWRALLNEDNLLADDGDYKVFVIPMAKVIEGGIPESTAKSNYYYKDGQVHARALAHLGFYGVIQDGDLVVQSI